MACLARLAHVQIKSKTIVNVWRGWKPPKLVTTKGKTMERTPAGDDVCTVIRADGCGMMEEMESECQDVIHVMPLRQLHPDHRVGR